MAQYRDNKGISYSSELSRDRANERYLDEERSSRALMEAHQIEQTRILEQNARAQQAHNNLMANIAIKEAKEAKAQREYTQELEWLKNSDAKSRFEFFQRKHVNKIINDQADYVFTKLKLSKYVNPDRLADLHSKLNDLLEPYLKYSKLKMEYSTICMRLESLEKTESDAALNKKGCGCVILFLGFISILGLGNPEAPPGVLIFVFLLLIALPYRFLSINPEFKKVKKSVEEAKNLKSYVEKKFIKSQDALNQKLIAAQIAYRAWNVDAKPILDLTIQKGNQIGLWSKRQKHIISELEKPYPPLLRIDWSSIDSSFLRNSTNAILNDIQQLAESKLSRPEIILAELSLNHEEDLYKLLTGTPEILAIVVKPD